MPRMSGRPLGFFLALFILTLLPVSLDQGDGRTAWPSSRILLTSCTFFCSCASSNLRDSNPVPVARSLHPRPRAGIPEPARRAGSRLGGSGEDGRVARGQGDAHRYQGSAAGAPLASQLPRLSQPGPWPPIALQALMDYDRPLAPRPSDARDRGCSGRRSRESPVAAGIRRRRRLLEGLGGLLVATEREEGGARFRVVVGRPSERPVRGDRVVEVVQLEVGGGQIAQGPGVGGGGSTRSAPSCPAHRPSWK